MPHNPLEEDDEPYVSAEDSDFAPDDAQDADSGDSDADEPATSQKRKEAPAPEAEDAGENSGDEAILSRGKKKLRKEKDALKDEEGGEGGLIKTRSQRAVEKEEKKMAASMGPVTIDVDAMWEQMKSGQPIEPARPKTPDGSSKTQPEVEITPSKNGSPAMIKIKRTYNFAGQVHTEEKMVARDSAEARLYLASQGDQPVDASPPKRVTKKAFRSVFEPVLDASSKRLDLNLGVAARMQAAKEAEAKKLNTVEKSRMDWAGYVDKEGIKDELEMAGKSKDSYNARQDFLARSEAIREEDSRKARMAGRT